MSKTPRTFIVGVTAPDVDGVLDYLLYTGQADFDAEFREALNSNIGPMALVSFYAKLCYKSLTPGKNANVSKVRGIRDNLLGVFDSGHGSVFEHVSINFVTTDCSRVFTHELVRHRVGTAFSQTSGRYVSIDDLDIVLPPELADDPTAEDIRGTLEHGLRTLRRKLIRDDMPFAEKKRLTSAIRRLAPNGQVNEIGWSVNIRALRHLIELRTARHAEWEIRAVFHEVAELIRARWPLMLYGGTATSVDGFNEWTGLKV